jgi:hypothetical protein
VRRPRDALQFRKRAADDLTDRRAVKGTRIGSDVCECEPIVGGDIWAVDQESFGLNERLDGTTSKKLSARFVVLRELRLVQFGRSH